MLRKLVRRFLSGDEAATSVEYAVMLMLIVAVCLSAIQLVGANAIALFEDNSEKIDQAMNN